MKVSQPRRPLAAFGYAAPDPKQNPEGDAPLNDESAAVVNTSVGQHETVEVSRPAAVPSTTSISPLSTGDLANSVEIPLALIDPGKYQPRLVFSEAAVQMLADSIKEVGQLVPITVRETGTGRYELIAGERRVRAHELLNRTTILAQVRRDVTETEAAINSLADNEARDPLCDYERAKAFRRIMGMKPEAGGPKMTGAYLARQVGVSESTVSRCLKFFELPPAVIEILEETPNLIGSKNVPTWVTHAKNGHTDIVLSALKRIRDFNIAEQVALTWATSEINRLNNPPKRNPVPLSIKGVSLGTIKTDGSKIVISCDKGISVDQVLAALADLK